MYNNWYKNAYKYLMRESELKKILIRVKMNYLNKIHVNVYYFLLEI